MPVHFTQAGGMNEVLKRYMDMVGFIPEAGDHYDHLAYDEDWQPTEDEWRAFVRDAVLATEEAKREAAERDQRQEILMRRRGIIE